MAFPMNAYRLAVSALFYPTFPFFWGYSRISGKGQRGLAQRLGRSPRMTSVPSGGPRIWLHAASVGEVGVAHAIVRALDGMAPGCRYLVSTITETGLAAANARFGSRAICTLAPLDVPAVVDRALDRVQPDVLVWIETELWPVWLDAGRRRGIAAAVVNGRLSDRSVRRYRRVYPLVADALAGVSVFSMIGPEDAERVAALGAAPQRIRVHGNAKYDRLIQDTVAVDPAAVREYLGLAPDETVWVAGSTRGDEETAIFDAYRRLRQDIPALRLVVVPRHVPRVLAIRELAAARGLCCRKPSDLPKGTDEVIVVDTMGQLFGIYGVADVVFCGGSLAARGGQNILEPAAWGKPVIFGPHMADFKRERDALVAAGGGFEVTDGESLAQRVGGLLADPAAAATAGRAAVAVASAAAGAARRHAEVIRELLPGPEDGG